MSPEEELKQLKQKLEKDPDNLEFLYRKASLLQQLGRFGEALNDLNRILEIQPHHREALQRAEYIRTILKFTNTDIFSDTNTDHDPWME